MNSTFTLHALFVTAQNPATLTLLGLSCFLTSLAFQNSYQRLQCFGAVKFMFGFKVSSPAWLTTYSVDIKGAFAAGKAVGA